MDKKTLIKAGIGTALVLALVLLGWLASCLAAPAEDPSNGTVGRAEDPPESTALQHSGAAGDEDTGPRPTDGSPGAQAGTGNAAGSGGAESSGGGNGGSNHTGSGSGDGNNGLHNAENGSGSSQGTGGNAGNENAGPAEETTQPTTAPYIPDENEMPLLP